jgi:hypothetical protein
MTDEVPERYEGGRDADLWAATEWVTRRGRDGAKAITPGIRPAPRSARKQAKDIMFGAKRRGAYSRAAQSMLDRMVARMRYAVNSPPRKIHTKPKRTLNQSPSEGWDHDHG